MRGAIEPMHGSSVSTIGPEFTLCGRKIDMLVTRAQNEVTYDNVFELLTHSSNFFR